MEFQQHIVTTPTTATTMSHGPVSFDAPRHDLPSESFEGDAGHYSEDMDSMQEFSSHSDSSGEAPESIVGPRSCDFCGATQTPMWRRGPSGKATLCNACGVKWALRRKNSRRTPGSSTPTDPSSATAGGFGEAGDASFRASSTAMDSNEPSSEHKDVYWCKYCNLTWPLSYFKNRQQFGAHCSNCSRKRKSRDIDYGVTVDEPSFGRDASSRDSGRNQHRRSVEAHLQDVDFETALEHPRPDKKRKIFYGNSSYLEDPCDSDTETTVNTNNSSLSKLLSAVETVLSEERTLDAVRSEMKRLRQQVLKIDAARKSALDEMERWINAQLEYLQQGVSSATSAPAVVAAASAAAQTRAPSFSALDALSSVVSSRGNVMLVDSLVKQETPNGSAPATADEIGAAALAHREEQETSLVASETMKAATLLRSALDSAMAVQNSVSSDLEQLRSKFSVMLHEFKLQVSQELLAVNEALAIIRMKQQQAGAPNAGLSHDQINQINQDVHLLNVRMQNASRNFQAQYMHLSQQLAERLELAKQSIVLQLRQHQRQFEEILSTEERRMSLQLDALRMQMASQMFPVEARLSSAVSILDATDRSINSSVHDELEADRSRI